MLKKFELFILDRLEPETINKWVKRLRIKPLRYSDYIRERLYTKKIKSLEALKNELIVKRKLGDIGKHLLDNQMQECLYRESYSLIDSVDSNITMGVSAIVAEMYEKLLSPIIGVQPMGGPVSLIFKMRYNEDTKEDGSTHTSLQIVSKAVEAVTRKLSGSVNIESAQDFEVIHGIDIRNELINVLGQEISDEIFNEHFNNLLSVARPLKAASAGITTTENLLKHVPMRIMQMSHDIARKTRRGMGNFVIVSPTILAILQASSHAIFTNEVDEHTFKGPSGTLFAGTLNGTIRVYVTLSLAESTVLVGYKGRNGETDTGYITAPYLPVLPHFMVDEISFTPQIVFSTRFGIATDDTTRDYYMKADFSKGFAKVYKTN